MSSDEHSSSSSDDEEDLNTTGLIATRAKRSTAGNLYETLRANLDDEELQKELLAEDEDDQGEYEGSEKDDEDDALESSSDEEDAGPPKDGEQEDLEGEKELKKAERAANKKKRKMEEAKMRLPAWQKKRVKLADDVKMEDGAAPKPKKKSERSNWLPTEADMPVRQSARASAIANREVVHTNLKESALRSEKQKKVMANHAEKVSAKKRADLTQEQRLEKAIRIEKETAREFGRWEREEAERQRIREEQLAAKRQRGIDGPVIRHWSGSVLWVDDKIKNKRLHGSVNVDEIKDEVSEESKDDSANVDVSTSKAASTADVSLPTSGTGTPLQQFLSAPLYKPPAPAEPSSDQPVSWLDGIQEYAAQQTPSMPLRPAPYTPSAPAISGASTLPPQQPSSSPYPSPYPQTLPPAQSQLPAPQIYHGWPPSHPDNLLHRHQAPRPPVPPPAPIKEQAQRSLIMLEQFENLEHTTTGKRGSSKASKDASLEPTPLAATLLPLSYPSFTPEQSRYLTTKMKITKGIPNIPAAPEKTRCALTSWPAKFRDPKTGLPYADLQTYKMIQRILAGGCQWSGLLGAWSGPHYGAMGRAAAGVPEGFGTPATVSVPASAPVVEEIKQEGGT